VNTLIKYTLLICGVYFVISCLADNPQFFADVKIYIDDKINEWSSL
jgi:hypothetical protein